LDGRYYFFFYLVFTEVDRTAPAVDADKIAAVDFISVYQAVAIFLVDFQVPEANYPDLF